MNGGARSTRPTLQLYTISITDWPCLALYGPPPPCGYGLRILHFGVRLELERDAGHATWLNALKLSARLARSDPSCR
jgi:hypothetical protein